ncbi:hypothetical protein E2C01_082128 [Portunus trituberculatus]|uniref:Uncharacterized protein n=1 Tax=Portunus trituberculatus TaxID=210409 RepID=A0A5B7IP54_PORTR|nr:hypothetical protein [Portunus trituberculatus]
MMAVVTIFAIVFVIGAFMLHCSLIYSLTISSFILPVSLTFLPSTFPPHPRPPQRRALSLTIDLCSVSRSRRGGWRVRAYLLAPSLL